MGVLPFAALGNRSKIAAAQIRPGFRQLAK